MRRFANDRIAQLVDFIETPNVDKVRTSSSPYFFGLNEDQWRAGQDLMHQEIKEGGRGYNAKQRIKRKLMNDLNISDQEAWSLVNWSQRGGNQESRHVNKGVPHAFQQEEIARLAMMASDNPAMFNQTDSQVGTDLVAMLGKLEQFVDVQNIYLRPGRPDKMSLGVLQGLNNNVALLRLETLVVIELQDIIEDAKRRSGTYGSDKLYEERGLEDVKPDMVKDLIITAPYDVLVFRIVE